MLIAGSSARSSRAQRAPYFPFASLPYNPNTLPGTFFHLSFEKIQQFLWSLNSFRLALFHLSFERMQLPPSHLDLLPHALSSFHPKICNYLLLLLIVRPCQLESLCRLCSGLAEHRGPLPFLSPFILSPYILSPVIRKKATIPFADQIFTIHRFTFHSSQGKYSFRSSTFSPFTFHPFNLSSFTFDLFNSHPFTLSPFAVQRFTFHHVIHIYFFPGTANITASAPKPT